MHEELSRDQLIEFLCNAIDDRPSGPTGLEVLAALGVPLDPSPKLPKKAVIDLQNKTFHIDGQEFPWWITEQGVEVEGLLDPNTLCALSFTMLAETVEIIPRETTPDSPSK